MSSVIESIECPKSRIESFWDALQTVVFLFGAFLVEYLTERLFPNGVDPITRIVVVISQITFVGYAVRQATDEIRCVIKSVAMGYFEIQKYREMLVKKRTQLTETSKPSHEKVVSKKNKKSN